jgi:2-hydroxy-3-keto-5-methylthiopentenyl-1-phosphate phosphatase
MPFLPAPHSIVRLFIDFDGTIVPQDVGNFFFEQFSGVEMWEDNRLYVEGEISARELYHRNTRRIRRIDEEMIDAFCSEFSVDPGFPRFVEWSRREGYPLVILSDGLDAYIERILRAADCIPEFHANHLALLPGGGCEVILPTPDEHCDRCANCKRNHILTRSGDRDIVVLIGDGVSDFCPSRYADLVFAKGKLETHCQRENIRFRRFDNFDDVLSILRRMISTRVLQRRGQTELRRKDVWLQG